MKEWLNVDTGEFKTLEDGIVIKGINWVKVPEGAEICHFFSGDYLRSGEDNFTFYKNGITEVYNGEEDGWINTDSSCFDFILNKGKLVWKRGSHKDTDDSTNNGDSIKPVKSDGGSSSYYFTALPEHLIKDIVKRGGIEIKDIVRYCFDNDADCKDIIKALKRIRENLKGSGKEGVDSIYDANKVCFFAEELRSSLKECSKHV